MSRLLLFQGVSVNVRNSKGAKVGQVDSVFRRIDLEKDQQAPLAF